MNVSRRSISRHSTNCVGTMTLLTAAIAQNLVQDQGSDVDIPGFYTSIAISAFRDLGLTSVAIPNSIESIGNGAFASNNLVNLVIPQSVETIGNNAFASNSLENLFIADGVKMINANAFRGNELQSIVIPGSVEIVGTFAFEDNPLELITTSFNPLFDASLLPSGVEVVYGSKPTDLLLSETVFDESIAKQSTIGLFSSVDPDSELGDTFTYTLVDGGADSDNEFFEIEGNQLKVSELPDFAVQKSFLVNVKTTDSRELSFEKAFTLQVDDFTDADPSLEFNFAAGENFSAAYRRDINPNKDAKDRVGYKGTDGIQTYFVVKDAGDDPQDPDPIVGGIEYSLMLVKRGVSAEEALDSGEYLLSGKFVTESSKRDFVTFNNEDVSDFKKDQDSGQKYDVLLYSFDASEEALTRGVGMLNKVASDSFSARYDRLMADAIDLQVINGIDITSFV